MNKEIKEKVEARRQELKAESERLRKEAKEKHVCANCGKPLPPGRRTYCSDGCSEMFFRVFDYSHNSQVLKDYTRDLKREYAVEHPKPEREPWSQPVANKIYPCDFCGTRIEKGEKYEKYVRLPEYDEWFDDAPYETLRYHITCQEFINLLSNAGVLSDEGFDEDEVSALLAVIALEMHKDYEILINEIVSGVFPSRDELERIANDYEFFEPECHWESDHSGYRYVYSVRYESFNRPLVRVHSFLSELKDPESFFYYYYREINGPEFNRILSVKGIKIPLPKVEMMETTEK